MTSGQLARVGRLVLRLLVAAGLAVDAYVHADLAPVYAGIHASISQGSLFRIEAGAAAAAALIVLVAGRRAGFGLAFTVAGSAFAALVLYRYVDVGRLGPLPNMYEPSWFPEKTAAAVAEGAAMLLAACGLIEAVRHRQAARSARRSRWLGLAGAAGVVAGLAVAGFAGQGTDATPVPAAAGGQAAGSQAAGGQAAAGQQVTIVGNSLLRFAPMMVHLHTGTVRITLKDSGAYPHNIVIPALGVTSPSVTGDPGGAQVSFTVTFHHPGSYAFSCQYHASAGMTGTFVVS